MDGWMDGYMNEWMDGWVGGWVGGWMDGWMDGHRWLIGQANAWVLSVNTHTLILVYSL